MWRNNKDLGLNENHSPSRARPRAFCEDCNGSGIGDGYYCHTCYGTGMTHELNDEWKCELFISYRKLLIVAVVIISVIAWCLFK